MKDNKSLEEIIKSKLSDRELPATPQLWERIAKRLPDEEPVSHIGFFERNKYLLAASVTGLLLTLGAFLFYYTNKVENTVAQNKSIPALPEVHPNNSTIETPLEEEEPAIAQTQSVENKKELKQENTSNLKPEQKNSKDSEPVVESLVVFETKEYKSEVSLPDSSVVFLNKNSTLSYSKNFNTNDRVVNLSGEGFFDIKKANGKKFTIHCHNSTTVVLGTSFNLISHKNQMRDEVEVVSGRVQFFSKEFTQNPPLILTKGMKGIVDKNELTQTVINDPNFLAWQTEKLVFNKAKMDNVISTLEKYFNISIKVNDSDIMKLSYNGSFEKPELKQVLDVICKTSGLTYDSQGNEYTLKAKEKK